MGVASLGSISAHGAKTDKTFGHIVFKLYLIKYNSTLFCMMLLKNVLGDSQSRY